MKRGQTAVVNLGAKALMSVAGFGANWYIARKLGDETLGTYALILSVLAWVVVGGSAGVPTAIKKRVSETGSGSSYISSGAAIQTLILCFFIFVTVAFRGQLRSYIGADILPFFLAMLCFRTAYSFLTSVLDGQQKVHISSLLDPFDVTIRSSIQIAAITLGMGLIGLLWGYIIAGGLTVLAAVWAMKFERARPSVERARDIASYARYAWASALRGRTFAAMDTIVLGFFVAKGLVGVYVIAWNISSLFAIFGVSISRTLFPDISSIAETGSEKEVGELINAGLSYAGLFLVPGLIGAAIVGETVLSIYGEEFVKGQPILIILTISQLFWAFESQLTTALDAIDRPDITFRIVSIFIATNLVLNVFLVWQIGWIGAAIATAVSTVVSGVLSYYALSREIPLEFPLFEIMRQIVAALIMGFTVYSGKLLFGASVPVVIGLILVGATAYIVSLYAISAQFRMTVKSNVPFRVPF